MNESERMQDLAGIRILIEAKQTACTEKFGEWLFGTFRNKKEPDTKMERKIFNSLESFIGDNQIQSGFKNELLALKKCMGEFGDILKPNTNILYRGTTIRDNKFLDSIRPKNIDELTNVVDKNKDIIMGKNIAGDFYNCGKKYTYKSRREIQSWTSNKEISAVFAMESGNGRVQPGIIKAKFPKSELLFNPSFMNKISKGIIGISEFEIVRISNKVTTGELYVLKDDLLPSWNEGVGLYVEGSGKNTKIIIEVYNSKDFKDFTTFMVNSGYQKSDIVDIAKEREIELTAEIIKDFKYIIKVFN